MKRTSDANTPEELSPKVYMMYQAVVELMLEGADINSMKVSDITNRAGIGKGTAYDYFESKDEIIVSAIIFSLDQILIEVEEKISQIQGFQNRMEYLFSMVDEMLGERECLLKFVHLLLGSSSVAFDLQGELKKKCNDDIIPMNVMDKIVRQGVEAGEIDPKYPIAYTVYMICTKILMYAMLLDSKKEERPLYAESVDMKEMRKFLLEGIIQEFLIKR